MPNYRRWFVPGGTYFFTLKTQANAAVFDEARAALLGVVLREAKQRWPFETIASVLLPDHLHVIWALPSGDIGYPMRLGWIKKEFTKRHLEAGGREEAVSASCRGNRRRGVWQRRYWEHTVQNEEELFAYVDYVHYNPVKHGYVASPGDWPWSTFLRWVESGEYEANWGQSSTPKRVAAVIEAGE